MSRRYRPENPYPAGPRPCVVPGCTQTARSRHKLCGPHLRELAAEVAHERGRTLEDVTDFLEEVEARHG